MKQKLYISGPMTGVVEHNFPAFRKYAKIWEEKGYEVIDPSRNFEGRTGLKYEEYFREDVKQILEVDGLAMIPGWQKSKGANTEYQLARRLNLFVLDGVTGEVIKEGKEDTRSVCQIADDIVSNDRGNDYGHPKVDFSKVAAMASAAGFRIIENCMIRPLKAEDHAIYMMFVKISRLTNKISHRDSIIDLAGYAKTLDMVIEKRKQEESLIGSCSNNTSSLLVE